MLVGRPPMILMVSGTHEIRECVRVSVTPFPVVVSVRCSFHTKSTSSFLADDPRWPLFTSFPEMQPVLLLRSGPLL